MSITGSVRDTQARDSRARGPAQSVIRRGHVSVRSDGHEPSGSGQGCLSPDDLDDRDRGVVALGYGPIRASVRRMKDAIAIHAADRALVREDQIGRAIVRE